MILIADGGSTKADWIALKDNKELFRVRTSGLNPDISSTDEIIKNLKSTSELCNIKNEVTNIYFYGAGCGTSQAVSSLKNTFTNFFLNAKIFITEDMLGAVYACTVKPAIVAILGTGSNSCYFDGESITVATPSLGYSIMDDASGNYFGKQLLRDYFYKQMPDHISTSFKKQFDLEPYIIKKNLYSEQNPNKYLASFAIFMVDFKEDIYIRTMIEKGFDNFFKFWILPFNKKNTPIYFIGSIAHSFRSILDKSAHKQQLKVTGVIQRPIDNLVNYHIENNH